MTHPDATLRAVVLTGLLLLAGCAAPATQGPPSARPSATPAATASEATTDSPPTTAETTTTAEGTAIADREPTLTADSLPVAVNATWDRVAAMLDSDVSRPSVRVVEAVPGGTAYGSSLKPMVRLLLDVDGRSVSPRAYYSPASHQVTVLVHDGDPAGTASPARLEAILAHEYAHAVLIADERYGSALAELPAENSFDRRRAHQAMREGSAVYVADAYADRYLPNVSETGETTPEYRGSSELSRFVGSAYLFGDDHFERRVDAPANLTRVCRNPPKTTEQLLHPSMVGSEPPRNLSVTATGSENLSLARGDTLGESFVRDLLGARVPESRAAAAATAWGHDRAFTLWDLGANGSARNYLWALRWDDARNATEFERTFAAYMDARGERLGDRRWRTDEYRFGLRRASDETVVVVIGGRDTVRRVTATASDGNVSVTVPSA